jgi:hypothetical protein
VAAGTLIYVLRELLRARLEDVGAVGAMWALVIGMLLGLGSELVTELGDHGWMRSCRRGLRCILSAHVSRTGSRYHARRPAARIVIDQSHGRRGAADRL